MFTFTGMQEQCQSLSQDFSTPALAFFKTNLNIGQDILETELGSFYTEETAVIDTIANTLTYKTPANFLRLKKAYVTVGSTRYPMEEVYDEDEWQAFLINGTGNTASRLSRILVRRDNFEVYPTPSNSGDDITLIYEANNQSLVAEDYITGSIQTLANGSKSVTGSGTTFTAAMVGRFLQITSNGAWYKIASYTSATVITLDKAYEGISISAGSEAYIIGQMPRTPFATHHVPVYFSLMQYFNGFKLDEAKGNYYRGLYELDMKRAKKTYSRRYSSQYISGANMRLRQPINPNLYPGTMS